MRPRTPRRGATLASIAAGVTLLIGCAHPGDTAPVGGSPTAHDAAPGQRLSGFPGARGAAPADAPTASAAAPGAAHDAAAFDALAPGLYALDRLAIATNGTTVTIRAQRPCEDVLDEIEAGQWAARVIPADQNPLAVTMAVLSSGDRLAMVYLKDSESSCVGSITVASRVDLTAGGTLTAANAGIELPLYCHVGPNLDGDDLRDLTLSYFGLFATATGSFVMMLSGPATVGTHPLTMDEEGSQGVTVLPLRPEVAPTDAALTFLGAFFAGQGDADSAFTQFTGMFYGEGTLDVASSDPLEATLSTGTLTAYDDSADTADQTLNLTAPLHCAQ